MYYDKELQALKHKDRFRQRKIYADFADLASNDYLGLSTNQKQIKKAYKTVLSQPYYSPKSSQLLGGYAPIHKKFEQKLCSAAGFESALLFGSGFLANLALVSTLPRKGDLVVMDSQYHASGIMGTQSCMANTIYFEHNNPEKLEEIIQSRRENKRVFIFVEGVYSMLGDILNRDIIDIANKYNAILVVDEAHSVGVIGENLLGVFDHYDLENSPNHIKMGTLGKALGSFGAYVLASQEIISFLENRARPFIYATALSIFDTALAYHNLKYILKHAKVLREKLEQRRVSFSSTINEKFYTPIAMIESVNNQTKSLHNSFLENKILTGLIRPPTTSKTCIRVVISLSCKNKEFEKFLSISAKADIKRAY